MTFSERTTPGVSGDYSEDLPVKKVVELTKNPDGSAQKLTVDLSTSLANADPSAGNELAQIGVNGEVVTKIESVDEVFYVVRLRNQDVSSSGIGFNIFNENNKRVNEDSPRRMETMPGLDPLVLVHFHPGGSEDAPSLSARAINDEFPLHVGKNVPKDVDPKAGRFSFPDNEYVSGKHFNLVRNGNESIQLNVTSSNLTKVTYAETAGSSEQLDEAHQAKLNRALTESAGVSLAESDGQRLIEMPDWGKDNKQEENSAEPIKAKPEEKDSKTPQQEFHDKFWSKHQALIERIDNAIKNAGHIDPSGSALAISGDIEAMRQMKGLNPEMSNYLKGAIDACDEAVKSGRSRNGNPRAGLAKAKAIVSAIKQDQA